MDYKELAHEIVLDILQDSVSNIRINTEFFSNGEKKMLGSLLLFKDGMTGGELSQAMNVSTARIAEILNALEKREAFAGKPTPPTKG